MNTPEFGFKHKGNEFYWVLVSVGNKRYTIGTAFFTNGFWFGMKPGQTRSYTHSKTYEDIRNKLWVTFCKDNKLNVSY